jgi:predicted protein tyrosine phosphatase
MKKVTRGLAILWWRLTEHGLRATGMWAADHAVRLVTGAPIRRVSQIAPNLHVGGQYAARGWPRMEARGVTAVVNLRIEFDDKTAGIAPLRYLHLPTVDDDAPTLDQLRTGVEFIAEETARGGGIYIHCASGVGRAATMAAAQLISTGMSPDQAWMAIRKVRPFVRPTAVQIEQIERFAAEVRS